MESLRWCERRAGEGNVAMYLVQIINEPHQLITLKVRHTSPIPLPIEYVAELIVEVEGRSIEVMELLYDWRIE